MRALELLQRDDIGAQRMDEILAAEFKCSSRTAYSWLKEAREQQREQMMQIPEPAHHNLYTIEDANKNPYDVNGHRWQRVQQYLMDIETWRYLREKYRVDHSLAKKDDACAEALRHMKWCDERLLAWEKQFCEILHFSVVAPDRGLSDANVRGLIVSELARNITVLTPEECDLLRAAIDQVRKPAHVQDAGIAEVMPN